MGIVVFGSVNMDLVTRCDRLPLPGETLVGQAFLTIPGGKGANQAVAAARLGVPTELVGRVGQDEFGRSLLTGLRQAGVGCDRVFLDADCPSGIAAIAVDRRGENHIIIVPGANGAVDGTDLQRLAEVLPQADALLLQLEIPLVAVEAAAALSQSLAVPVLLDPAPARPDLSADLLSKLYMITPNQGEASQLVGYAVSDRASACQAALDLQAMGVAIAIVKLGAQGVVAATPEGLIEQPAFPVEVVDMVAAGDAFSGGLASAIAQKMSMPETLRWASAVAALSVTQPGAQPSMPERSQVEQFLSDR